LVNEETKPKLKLEFEYGNAKQLRNIIKAVCTLLQETDFAFSEEGVRIKSMDPSHAAMADLTIPKSAFTIYDPMTLGKTHMNLTDLTDKVLHRAEDEPVTFTFNNEQVKVGFKKLTRTYTKPLLEPSDEETPIPNLTFNAELQMETKTVKRMFDELAEAADNVYIKTEGNMILMVADTELSKLEFPISKEDYSFTIREPSNAIYNLNYLTQIFKALPIISDKVTLQWSQNMPLKITPNLDNGMELSFYLAPRIEGD
jgi:proliferating cell nuclear antigen